VRLGDGGGLRPPNILGGGWVMGLGDGAVEGDLVLWERLGDCLFVWRVEEMSR